MTLKDEEGPIENLQLAWWEKSINKHKVMKSNKKKCGNSKSPDSVAQS